MTTTTCPTCLGPATLTWTATKEDGSIVTTTRSHWTYAPPTITETERAVVEEAVRYFISPYPGIVDTSLRVMVKALLATREAVGEDEAT